MPQKELEQLFPYIEEHESNLDQDIFMENVPPLKIIKKQVNPSQKLSVDLLFSTLINKKVLKDNKS